MSRWLLLTSRLSVVLVLAVGFGCTRSGGPRDEGAYAPGPRLSASAIQARSGASSLPRNAAYGVAAEAGVYRLKTGDPLVIFLRGIGTKDETIEDKIDEKGYIDMPFIGSVLAVGKTQFQLEKDIQQTYLDRQIYKNVSVSVVMPSQGYFIRGEVRQPGRFPMITGVTLMQAVATAGGFSEFAESRRVKLIRGERVTVHNLREIERKPEKDVYLESGDVIVVERSLF